jgi:hypothetical protein
MDVKGFLNRFEACTVNGQRFVNQSDVEFLIDQLGLNKSDKSDLECLSEIGDKLHSDSYCENFYKDCCNNMTSEKLERISYLVFCLSKLLNEK